MDHGVELIGEARLEVMREPLRLGPVDHPDRTLEPSSVQPRGHEQQTGDARCMEELLPAALEGTADVLAFGGAPPVRCGGDGAGVRREADEERVAAVPFADELSDVELSRLSELSRARVTDVRVVRPDDGLGRRAGRPLQMLDESLERL